MLAEALKVGIVVRAYDQASSTFARMEHEIERLDKTAARSRTKGGLSTGSYDSMVAAQIEKLNAAKKSLTERGMDNLRGGAAMAGAGAVLAGPFLASLPVAARFQNKMIEVSTLTNGVVKNLDQVSDSVLRMSSRFGQMPDTLAEALYQTSSAGYSGADGLRVLELSSKAAIAGVSDVSTAAMLGTGVLNSYGMTVDKLGYVFDVAGKGIQGGRMRMEQLAAVVGRMAPIAAAAHVEWNNLMAAHAGLTNAGMSTDEAATYIRGVIMSFASAPPEVQKQMDALNRITHGALNKAKASGDLPKLIDILFSATGGDLQKMRTYIPMVEATGGLAALMKNMDQYRAKVKEFKTSAGTMEEMYQKMRQSTVQQWNELKAGVMELAVRVGTTLLPALRDLFGQIGPIISRLTEWASQHPKLAKLIAETAVVLGGLTIAAGAARMGIGSLQYAFAMGLGTLQKMPGLVGMMSTNFHSMRSVLSDMPGLFTKMATSSWQFTMSALSNPYLWIGVAIVGMLAYTAFYLYVVIKRWDDVKKSMQELGPVGSVVLTGILDRLFPFLSVTYTIARYWDEIKETWQSLQNTANHMAAILPGVMVSIETSFYRLIESCSLLFLGLKVEGAEVAKSLGKAIVGALLAAVNTSLAALNLLLNPLRSLLKIAGVKIQPFGPVTGKDLEKWAQPYGQFFHGMVSSTVKDAKTLGKLGGIFAEEGKGLLGGSLPGEEVTKQIGALKDQLLNAGKNAGSSFLDGLQDGLKPKRKLTLDLSKLSLLSKLNPTLALQRAISGPSPVRPGQGASRLALADGERGDAIPMASVPLPSSPIPRQADTTGRTIVVNNYITVQSEQVAQDTAKEIRRVFRLAEAMG